jgi:hypothetical protein
VPGGTTALYMDARLSSVTLCIDNVLMGQPNCLVARKTAYDFFYLYTRSTEFGRNKNRNNTRLHSNSLYTLYSSKAYDSRFSITDTIV